MVCLGYESCVCFTSFCFISVQFMCCREGVGSASTWKCHYRFLIGHKRVQSQSVFFFLFSFLFSFFPLASVIPSGAKIAGQINRRKIMPPTAINPLLGKACVTSRLKFESTNLWYLRPVSFFHVTNNNNNNNNNNNKNN